MKRNLLFAVALCPLLTSVVMADLIPAIERIVQGRIGWALRILRQKAR